MTTDAPLPVHSIEETIKAFQNGEFVIVLDSPSRENEGDLIIAADAMTPAKMAFLVRWSSGIVCAPLLGSQADRLELPQMLPPGKNADPNGTAYTVSIDAAHAETTTGVSAADRSLTVRQLADPKATAASFRRPGHVFPLRARDGGVLERPGHTEAAVDFCRLAGRAPVGVIAELVHDGMPHAEGLPEYSEPDMMRGPQCVEFANRWGLKICTIEHLVEYRNRIEAKTNGSSH